MEQQVATEPHAETEVVPVSKPATASLLETWASNERMRHVPSAEWLVWKVDADLRDRVRKALISFESAPAESPQRAAMEADLRALCRALDRIADVSRHTRMNGHQGELPQRVMNAFNHAVASLRSIDSALFGRRYPFQTFERSKGEPLYGALLMALDYAQRLITHARAVDRDLDERLLAGLVTLKNPVDDRMLKPMA